MKILAAVLAFLTLSIGGYTMIETLNIESLVHRSDVVVLADVIGIKSVGRLKKNVEVFACLVKVNEPLKGGIAVGEELKIKTYRGIEDSPLLTEKTRVLLFLKRVDGYYKVFNGVQGCWPLESDGKFSGMGDGKTLEMVKDAIETPAPASSAYIPIQF